MGSLGIAQTVQLRPPVLGYYFDSGSRSIRPIAGVPGAAAVDGDLPVGSKLELAAISPSRDYAFASSLESDRALLVSFNGSEVTGSRALDEARSGFDAAYFSPDGRSAALVWKADGLVQIWTNLPGNAQLSRQAQIGDFVALAVSNGGDRLAISDGTGVRFLGADATLLAGTGFSALAFSPLNADLAAANRDLGQLSVISGDKRTDFAAEGPQAIAFSGDGSRLIAAAANQILSFDLATGSSSAQVCDCTVSVLERVQGNSVFRISAAKDGYFSLFDGDSAEPRITLIAAGGNQ